MLVFKSHLQNYFTKTQGTATPRLRRALNETPSQSYGCHLPYRITQCYLPPETSEHTSP